MRWRSPLARCGDRGCWDGWAEPLVTWPNIITALRTLVALSLTALALPKQSVTLLLVGLFVHWGGDVLDGSVARWLHQETRGGALFDVLADRVCALAFWLPWAAWHPDVVWPIALYVLEFALADALLSVMWLAWPLVSCNYVDRVDPVVHRLNWWPPAKAVNTAGLLVLVVVWPQPLLASAFVTAVLVVKCVSLVRLHRRLPGLPGPAPGCAAVS